jgi:uncharacterized repeat protein (TIGR01451 family)
MKKMQKFVILLLTVFVILGLTMPLQAQETLLLYSMTRNGDLDIINPNSGLTAVRIPIKLNSSDIANGHGLATNPVTGELWGIVSIFGESGRQLITINPLTGEATLIGNTNDFFSGLAFDSAGTLYGVTGEGGANPETLFTLSTTDATPTHFLDLGNGGGGETIAFNPDDGLLYHASGSFDQIFETIDLNTKVITDIPLTGSYNVAQALTYWDSEDVFLHSGFNSFTRITPAGVVTPIGFTEAESKGLAFVMVDPSSLGVNLTVTKSSNYDPIPLNSGLDLIYSVEVRNLGPNPGTGIILNDTLSEIVNFKSASDGCTHNNGVVTCDIGNLAYGESKTVEIIVEPQYSAIIENIAQVSGNEEDPNNFNNTVVSETKITSSVPSEIMYSIAVFLEKSKLFWIDPTNGSTVLGVSVSLPDYELRNGHGLATNPVTGELFALISTVNNVSERLLMTVNPITGQASLIGNTNSTGEMFSGLAFDSAGTLYGVTGEGGANPETLYTLSTTDATPTHFLDLGNGDGGETIAFNPDDGLLYHASGVSDQIFESINLTTSAITDIPLSGDFIRSVAMTYWNSQDTFLFAGESDLFTLTPGGVLSEHGQLDYASKGFAFPLSTPFASSDLSVTKVADREPVAVGEDLTYTITITNNGPEAAENVKLTDNLPANVGFVSASSSCSYQNGKVTCEVGTIEDGASAQILIVVQPSLGGTITNTASVSGTFTDIDTSNNNPSVTTTVIDASQANINKGKIIDKEKENKDSFKIILNSCTSLSEAVADIGSQTVQIIVGPYSQVITGSEFQKKKNKYIFKTQGKPKQKFMLFPDKAQIKLITKKDDINAVDNPIAVKVFIGDWGCVSEDEWTKKDKAKKTIFTLP